jgi:hypothetical protein
MALSGIIDIEVTFGGLHVSLVLVRRLRAHSSSFLERGRWPGNSLLVRSVSHLGPTYNLRGNTDEDKPDLPDGLAKTACPA